MADRLTQLQTALDTLLTQMYAGLHYITTHHSYGQFPNQPSQAPPSFTRSNSTLDATQSQSAPQSATRAPASIMDDGGANAINGDGDALPERPAQHQQRSMDAEIAQGTRNPLPDPKAVFESRLQELAQDIVIKEQQIEAIVQSLPGVGVGEREQMERIAELQETMGVVEREWVQAEREREELRVRLEGVLEGVGKI